MQYAGHEPVVHSRKIVRGYAFFFAGDQRSTAQAADIGLWKVSREQLILP